MAVTGKDIVAVAMKTLGQKGTQFWKDYGCAKGTAWCVIAVWDWFRMAGASNLFYGGKKVAYCPYELDWLRKNCKQVALKDAQQGDIVMFAWSKGAISHTGVAIKPLSSTVLQTIEGNTNSSNANTSVVAIRQRSINNIIGIFRPNYSKSSGGGGDKPAPKPITSKTFITLGRNGANVRSLPKVGSTIVGGIPYNKSFKVTEIKNGWAFAPDYRGWVCIGQGSDYYLAEVVNRTYQAVSKIGCNVRMGAGTKYARINGIPNGRKFKVNKVTSDGAWIYSVDYKGWVCARQGSAVYCKEV